MAVLATAPCEVVDIRQCPGAKDLHAWCDSCRVTVTSTCPREDKTVHENSGRKSKTHLWGSSRQLQEHNLEWDLGWTKRPHSVITL